MSTVRAVKLVNGVLRGVDVESALPSIYDQRSNIVSTITTGTAVTLPSSGSYTVSSGITSLNIYLNSLRLEYTSDWNTSGAGPSFTAVVFTMDLVAGDVVDFRTERNT
jgi:hypothetical protein